MKHLASKLALEKEQELLSNEKKRLSEEVEKSLTIFDEERAREDFEKLLGVNRIKGISANLLHIAKGEKFSPVYVARSRLLYDCYKFLMKEPVESIHYVSGGMDFEDVYVMSRMDRFAIDIKTPVYVEGNLLSSRNSLIDMEHFGDILCSWFHSHPGGGKGATNPSSTDKNHQERLERGGYKAIGGIFTRDGYVRFFSLNMKFEILIYGKGVEKIDETVYRLTQL